MTEIESPSEEVSLIREFEANPTLRSIQSRIDRLDVSADTKALLMDVAAVTHQIGGTVVAIGRKLMAFVLALARKFQNVAFGIIIALVLSLVLATIPLLGAVISALLTPIMLAFGITGGAMADFRNMAVERELDTLRQRVSIMAAQA
jgi:hypothetical protein